MFPTFHNSVSKELAIIYLTGGLITVGCLCTGAALNDPIIAALPAGFLLILAGMLRMRILFGLFLFSLPLSIEFYLPNGFATDLPTEPLMWLMTLLFLFFAFKNNKELNFGFMKHPLSMLLWLHLIWMGFMIFFAADPVIAFKFWLAKSWYVTACFLLGPRLLRNDEGFRWGMRLLLVPLTLVILYILARHAGTGFSFATVNKAMSPFFRNHVNYASIVVLCLPYVWWFWRRQRPFSYNGMALMGIVLLYLIAIQFSFTRAAYVGVVGAIGIAYVIRWRIMRYVIPIGLIGGALFLGNSLRNNEYLNHNPNYKNTVTHYRFDNLLEATAKGEDISTMERVYRWLAGLEMIRERPLTGFGPGNFYSNYRGYAVTAFETYVSDNMEGSGIHCYFLMTTVEQGIIGGILFLLLVIASLYWAERIYWQTTDQSLRRRLLAVIMSQGIIYLILLINDMVETDKVGTFFFINLGLLVHFDIESRKLAAQEAKAINEA